MYLKVIYVSLRSGGESERPVERGVPARLRGRARGGGTEQAPPITHQARRLNQASLISQGIREKTKEDLPLVSPLK